MHGMTLSSTAKWRWAMALLILGLYPVATVFWRPHRLASRGAMLPSDVPRFFSVTTRELVIFSAFFVIAWVFSRGGADDFLLRWQGGWRPVVDGLLYSVGLRMALFAVLVALSIGALMAGFEPEQIEKFVKRYAPGPERVVSVKALADPFYRLVLMTWGSFIVAGLREELWRVAMLFAGTRLLVPAVTPRVATAAALVFSSCLFGLGHIYQGMLAVGATAILGVLLGAIMLRHRSIWPAVIAHGAFDATSFLLLPLAKNAM